MTFHMPDSFYEPPELEADIEHDDQCEILDEDHLAEDIGECGCYERLEEAFAEGLEPDEDDDERD